jgi:mono/diheme cytochrome c family protein
MTSALRKRAEGLHRHFFGAVLGFLLLAIAAPLLAQPLQGDARKGQYLAKAAGCAGCHTDVASGAVVYSGGRLLQTPFGKFFGPNITPHPTAGIGKWSESDLRRAIRFGERPDGSHYFPSFPYPSFSGMTDGDIRDLWAFLRTLPPSERINKNHELKFPFGFRWLVLPWKWLFFAPGPLIPQPEGNPLVARGAYVASALGHCTECHTPRNSLGGLIKERTLAGGLIAEGRTPNLTPTRLARWTDPQLSEYLRTGTTPEGDVPSEAMDEVIRNSTSSLTPGDLTALVAYLRNLPPIPDAKR